MSQHPQQSLAQPFTPIRMTPEVARALEAEGYILPESWPFPARAVVDRAGWRLNQYGSLNPEHPRFMDFGEERIAPDGTRFVFCANGARPALLLLSKRLSPKALRVAPGQRRPKWVIEDAPKGEIPPALRAYLLQKGEKLAKGEPRLPRKLEPLAEQFAVEPAAGEGKRGRYGCGIRGIAAAFIGPRPRGKHGSEELRAWERAFRKLLRERPDLFPSKASASAEGK